MSLESMLLDRVRSRLLLQTDQEDEATLSSIRWNVLAEAAQILQIPYDPCCSSCCCRVSDRIPLSPVTFRVLDEAWFRITGTFTDIRITHQEKAVRDHFFFHAPHYADRTRLSQFLNVLVKRDTSTTTILYRLLAVDGFRGISHDHLRNYASHLSDRLPPVDELHVSATRNLYSWIERNEEEEGNVSGTVAAGLVLSALLRLYLKRVGCRIDRTARQVAEKALDCLDNRSRTKTIKKLIRVYRKNLSDDTLLDTIAFRKLVDYGKHALEKYLPQQ